MKKTNWAFIGCGKVVLKNKTTPFINKNNTIVGITTTTIKNAKNAKKKLKLKNCGVYDNVHEMLSKEKVDAIYICTPPKYHYIYLKEIYKYKIPVYVEKPFVISIDEAKEINKIYNNHNIPIFVAHYKRLTPKIKKLKKIILKGKIGKITNIDGIFNRKFDENLLNNSWIYNKDISGGGRFFDIAPHIFDVIYFIFGEFNYLKSNVEYEKYKHSCENKVELSFKIKDISCNLHFNFISNIDNDILYIYGEKGYIKTSINRDMPIYIYDKNRKLKKKIKFKKIKTWGIEAVKQINYFLNNKKKIINLCDSNDALKIQTYINNSLKNEK